jgi:tetratricopeptide (TPR) repeat protein
MVLELRQSSNRSSLMLTVAFRALALRRLGFAACATAFVAVSAEAADVTVRGAEMNRYGRIALTFDEVTKVNARAANGVLVLSFGQPTSIKEERLPAEMPAYVSAVRHDPDRTGLRIALAAPYDVNILEAGEKVFVDLLPENWTGLRPGLPPDVVAELARRAQEAEARNQAEALRRKIEGLKPMRARVASLPALTRIVFEPPGIVPVQFAAKGSEVTLLFEAPLALDQSQIAGQLAPAAVRFKAEAGPDSLLVRLTLAEGYGARGFREDETFVLDLSKPEPPASLAGEPVANTEARSGDAKPGDAKANAAKPAAAVAPVEVKPAPRPAPAAPAATGPVQAKAVVTSQGLRVVFPFKGRTAAAAYERAGSLTLVFHGPESLTPFDLPPAAKPFASLREIVREGAAVVARFDRPKPQIARLAPEDQAWVLTIGEGHSMPSRPLAIRRNADDADHAVVTVPLPETSGVHWIEDRQAGERVAVATAFGTPTGFAKPQRFVEFALLPTLHGVAVSALADDVAVRSAFDGVTIARTGGLSVSLLVPDTGPRVQRPPVVRENLVVQRDPWREAQLGNVLGRYREGLHKAAEAPRSERAAARVDLAHVLLANNLDAEVEQVLAQAAQEDPLLQHNRRFNLLRAIAALRMGRIPVAEKALATPVLAEDAEGLLWRASLDALRKQWIPALGGFNDSAPVLETYPEDLQAFLRLQSARAGIEVRDFVHADEELKAVASIATAGHHDEMLLLRARLDEASGRPEIAVDGYRQLMDGAVRPAAARATLSWIELSLQQGTLDAASAIERLETLAVVWRGDDVEAGTLARLGHLYAETGRWRQAFMAARRANQLFPDHPTTRALHDETARLFEDLFLTGKGDTLSRVDSLALYFDFKEFTPIGARGDEIVRRLADRLVSLDLLEQAAALLRHQVDNRLAGAARATVAARLVTVLLMDAKPAQALQALRATRLPELPRSINRARLLLEARALSDLSRTDLALEVLQSESGPEVDRLRADILWSGHRWRDAGEAHERLVGTRWQDETPLADQERNDLMRAAIAYSLADDALALDRLRAKFAAKMADSADAAIFGFVTQPNIASTRAFRELARRVTSADTLADFLAEYRRLYPEAAAAERPRGLGLQEPAPDPNDTPQAQATSAPEEPKG